MSAQRKILLGVLAAVWLAGCAGTPPSPEEEAREASATGNAPEEASSPDREGRQEAEGVAGGDNSLAREAMPEVELAPPPESGQASREDSGPQRFDISARDLPVRDVLLSLMEDTPFSVVIHPEVEGRVTLDLQEVTVPEALRFLGHSYGYGVTRAGERFFVEPATRRTRMFQVDYLDVAREGSSSTEISSGQITQNNVRSEGGGGSNQEGSKGSTISTESETDFWKQIRQGLSAIVGVSAAGEGEAGGSGDGSKLIIHSQSGVVLVRARPERLEAVADYLEAVEGSSHRQVIIEAKVLEVQLNDRFEAGVNWAALGQADLGGAGSADVLGSQVAPDRRSSNSATDQLGSEATDAYGQLTAGSSSGVFSAAVGTSDFTALLDLLQTQGEVNVLSSPRVATVNNQKAVIKVGVDEFFLTDISFQSNLTASGESQNYDVELTPFFSGIALDVTPQVGSEGMVTLHVHPSVSDVTSSDKEIELSEDQTLRFPLARSDVRESDSIVRAQDGQVVVIGGLMKETQEVNRSGVPLLSRIPLLGTLFRHRSESQVKRELVILLKPKVVPGQRPDAERQEGLKDLWERGLDAEDPG